MSAPTTSENNASEDIESETEIQFQRKLAAKARETQVFIEDSDCYKFTSSEESEIDNECSTDEEIWEEDEPNQAPENHPKPWNEEEDGITTKAVIGAVSLFLLLWQASYGVSGSALSVLLKFLKRLAEVMASLSGSQTIKYIAESLPVSLVTIRSLLGVNFEDYTVYAACPKCYSLYSKEHCTKILPDGRVVSKSCRNVM
jgi:hypothetical protein